MQIATVIECAWFRDGDAMRFGYRQPDGQLHEDELGPADLDLCTARVLASYRAELAEKRHGLRASLSYAPCRPAWLSTCCSSSQS